MEYTSFEFSDTNLENGFILGWRYLRLGCSIGGFCIEAECTVHPKQRNKASVKFRICTNNIPFKSKCKSVYSSSSTKSQCQGIPTFKHGGMSKIFNPSIKYNYAIDRGIGCEQIGEPCILLLSFNQSYHLFIG